MIKDKLTGLCGNGLVQNDFINTFCEIQFHVRWGTRNLCESGASQAAITTLPPETSPLGVRMYPRSPNPRNPKLETRNQKPETRNAEPENGNPKPEARIQTLGVFPPETSPVGVKMST